MEMGTEDLDMKNRKFYVGVYEIDLTVYKTGNMLIVYKNKVSEQVEQVYIKNPFLARYIRNATVPVDYVT